MGFRVGQKVVCICDNWITPLSPRPVKECVYTIRGIIYIRDQTGLLFEEIVHPPMIWREMFAEGNWSSCNFRPIVERKTDISVLEALLIPNVKIPELIR